MYNHDPIIATKIVFTKLVQALLKDIIITIQKFIIWSKGPSINDVSSEEGGGEGGGPPQKPMKGDENRYLICAKPT